MRNTATAINNHRKNRALTASARWRSPISLSVRARIIGGFGALVIMFAAVTTVGAIQEQNHKSELAQLDLHSRAATSLQTTEAQAAIAADDLERYVYNGDATYISEIDVAAKSAQASLVEAVALGAPGSDQLAAVGAQLLQGAAQALALREAGDTAAASAAVEAMVPIFHDNQLRLENMTSAELTQVTQLRASADRAGNLAFLLLVASGTLGVVTGLAVSFLVARSIVRPLTQLEATARRASEGDLSARAPDGGPRELSHLGSMLNEMMTAIEARTTDLRQANNQLRSNNLDLLEARNQAATDPLTGLGNHRSFHKSLRDEVIQAEEAASSVGLIMIDVDDFKGINDSLGHLAGDELLRDLANTLTQVAKKENTFRYGGDELAVLLPGVRCVAAVEVAERLRNAVSEMGGQAMTISLGVGCFPEQASSAEELIYRADMAMYWAKSSGRNRVAEWDDLQDYEVNRARHDYTDGLGERHDIVASLCAALKAKDAKTREQAERCSWYTAELAAELGLSEADVSTLREALRSATQRASSAN